LSIQEEFKRITGFELLARQTNCLSDKIERKDWFFNQLAILYFSSPKRFSKLKRKINGWLKREQSETIFVLTGYIYYINEDFKKAKECFLKTITLNSDNLDNWIDLAFTLRHNGEYKISNAILFYYYHLIYYYKYLGLKGCNYAKLKKLTLEIIKRTNAT
jgi:tetratricopeptide (TPR) repeat protein